MHTTTHNNRHEVEIGHIYIYFSDYIYLCNTTLSHVVFIFETYFFESLGGLNALVM